MSNGFRLIACFALASGLSACQKISTAKSTTAPGEDSASVRASWEQSSWAGGGGCSLAKGDNGYSFSGGVKIQQDGSVTLSTINTTASTIHNDLNDDGYKDIIIANSGNYEFVDTPFAQIRHQNDDHKVPNAEIYWGGPDGYDAKRHTGIPGNRPSSLAVADLNLDGRLDIVLAGGGEFHPPYVDSYIYWGAKDGYSESNRIALPTSASTGTAVGDFNKDGYPDVVFANLGNYNFPFPPSLVYWGGPGGFSPKNRTELETHGAGGIGVADVNNDSWLDIVFSNSAGFPPIEELMDYGQNYKFPDSYIYLGGPNGFSKDRRIDLPTKGATDVDVADLNKDGYLDIIYPNAGSFALPPLPDTYIYLGGPQGYSTARRIDLATNGASAAAVADLNKDGWPDIVLSVTGTYLYLGKPKFPNSYVYWGGPNGFSDSRRLALPTEASQGATITDVNSDGILDILFSQLGDFGQPYRPVLIYYGTGNKDAFYTTEKTATLPGQISYGSIIVGPDDGGDYMSHGDVVVPKYDRPDAYVTEGQLISSVARFNDGKPVWTKLEYSAEVPEGAQATLVMESSYEGEKWAEEGRVGLKSGRHSLTLADMGIKLAPFTRYKLILNSTKVNAAPKIRQIHFLQS
jgi:FG-GAP-like repeat